MSAQSPGLAALAQSLRERGLTVRSFQVSPSSINKEERSVETVMTTEQPVPVWDWQRGEIVSEILVMSGASFPAQLPLLDAHNRSSVKDQLGSVRNIRVEGDKLVGRDYFSSDEDAVRAFNKIAEGHVTDHSIGYRVLRSVTIEPGRQADIEGRVYKAPLDMPLRVALAWAVKELSVVPIGADTLAKVRSVTAGLADPAQSEKEEKVMTFEKWLEGQGFRAEELNTLQREAMRKLYETQQASANAPARAGEATAQPADQPAPDPAESAAIEAAKAAAVKAAEDVLRADAERSAQIRAICGSDVPPDEVERLIAEKKPIAEAQSLALKYLRENRPKAVAPFIGSSDGSMSRDDLSCLLMMKGGHDFAERAVKVFGEKAAERMSKRRWMSLRDIALASLSLDGRELHHSLDDNLREAFSTTSLPQILSNTANKSMLMGYEDFPQTWRQIARIMSVNSFKEHTGLRLLDDSDIEDVTDAGEIPLGKYREEYETIRVATRGRRIAITRQTIIDDDVGALTTVMQREGIGHARRLSKLSWTVWMSNGQLKDGVACWNANHRNLNTTRALSDANLSYAKAQFRKQTDAAKGADGSKGNPLDIEPRFLIVPPSLEETARKLLVSTTIIGWGGNTSTQMPTANIHQGSLTLIVEPRLENSLYPNYSATTWYLAAAQSVSDGLHVAFLNGVEQPTLEITPLDPSVLGIGFRSYLESGAGMMGWRTTQKNTA
ncbi:MAG TPA: Mu-like prophage major head subunit gpT family protein [Candidatus Brocadiia bacterium]|nr:Mu-like prophage major head subunit gpT family protein [Candidatus Brocadiia bacterium]